MPIAPEENILSVEQSEFDLKKFYRALRKRFWILIAVSLFIMPAVIIYNAKLTPEYRATTILMIESPQQSSVTGLKETQRSSAGQSVDYLNTQYEIIKGIALAKRVARELDLGSLPEFKGSFPELAVQNMLTLKTVKNSRLVEISINSSNPALAAKIANAYADLYIKQNDEGMLFMSQEILKGISEEPQQQGQTSAVRSEALDKEKIAEMLPSVANNPVLTSLKVEKSKIEAEIVHQSKRYRHKHPKIISLNSRLDFVNQQIKTKMEEILTNVKADLGGKLSVSNIRIIDKAEVPNYPSEDKKIRNLLLGGVLSLGLGLGLIFLLDSLDKTVKNKEDIQHYLRIPLLGNFPFLKELSKLKHGSAQLLQKIDKNMAAASAIREIRTGLTFSNQQKTAKIITVTSTVPKEGKSFLAAYLAFSFAKNGVETLLIDGDLRLPVANHFFGLNVTPGLGNLLSEEVALSDAIVKTDSPNLSILPAGTHPSDPAELFGSPKMIRIMQDLSQVFEKIIIDAPPSLLIPDAMILSKVSDATILVVKSGMVELKSLVTISKKFNAIDSTIMGFILNGLKLEDDSDYSGHYKSYYHNHHAKTSKREEKK